MACFVNLCYRALGRVSVIFLRAVEHGHWSAAILAACGRGRLLWNAAILAACGQERLLWNAAILAACGQGRLLWNAAILAACGR
ncbi:MAG: hypothetical protein DRI77_13705, partial [Chloroflexi bacterium]